MKSHKENILYKDYIMKLYRFIFLLFFVVSSPSLLAETTKIKTTGTTNVFIPIHQNKSLQKNPEYAALGGKYIVVETVELSPETKRLVAKHLNTSRPQALVTKKLMHTLPRKIVLGMNNVPVLDQGRHSTCSIFSASAAVDSIYGEDLISQLCYLELTSYLSQVSTHKNGWIGNDFRTIFYDFMQYGAISKKIQKTKGCGGVYDYPTHDSKDNGHPMSVADYLNHSRDVMQKVALNILLKEDDAFTDSPNAVNLVHNVKQTLSRGNRVLIAFLLDLNYGVGNLGAYKVQKDAWILTPEIIKDGKTGDLKGRHGLVVTGFDDDAYILDGNKQAQKGVFTVRNSWGPEAGDKGEFYMSYDYLQSLTFAAIEVSEKNA